MNKTHFWGNGDTCKNCGLTRFTENTLHGFRTRYMKGLKKYRHLIPCSGELKNKGNLRLTFTE